MIYCIGCFVSGRSQKCVVANPKENIVYLGIPNPLDFAVEGQFCKNLVISTDNGKIEPTDEACSYILILKNAGKVEITISDKKSKNHKVLGKAVFRAKYIPDPIAIVAGKSGGEIRKSVLKVQVGISTVLNGFDFDIRFKIENYTVSFFRDNKPTFTKNCNGAIFPQEVIAAFDTLQTNDRVIFSRINCKSPDGKSRTLLPIEFVIVD